MKIFNCILFNLLILSVTYAQNDYHSRLLNQLQNDYNLSGGTFVLGDSEADKFNTLNNYNGGGLGDEQRMTVSEMDISNQPFTKAFELNIPSRLSDGSTSNIGSIIRNRQAIENGDNMLLVFWAKGISNYLGFNGVAHVVVNGNDDIYNSFTYFNDEWTQYLIPMQSNGDFAPEELFFSLSYGYRAQSLQLGGVALINYGSSVDLSNLPGQLGINSYQGISLNASWRSPAKNRIENFRKANLKVNVVDQNNNPIEGAEVKVNMNEHDFGFGTAVSLQYLLPDNNSDDAVKYREKLFNLDGNGHGFNEAVFENAMKWHRWEDNWPNGTSKERKAEMVQYLKENDIDVRGHSLLWPSWSHMPSDIEENSGNPSYIKNRIKGHIQSILQQPGIQNELIDWDVINEITTERDIENSLGGRAFYSEVLQQAKQYAPNAALYLNDFMTVSYGGLGDRYEKCKSFLKEIDESGAPFDGIGFQCHLRDAPVGIPTVYSIFEDFNQTFGGRKEFKITEFDMINIDPSIQYQYMKDFLTISFSHEKLKSFVSWGFWDADHWRGNAPFFDENWNLKPSGQAFVDLVFGEWWTIEQTNSNDDGIAAFRPFKGKHTVTVSYNGASAIYDVDLTNDREITIRLNVSEPEPGVLGDVNCDGEVNSVDALFILQYSVGIRTESSTCPLQSPGTEIYTSNGDVNNDGAVTSVDALFVLQCSVGISNTFCENANGRNTASTESLLSADKRLKAHPNLFQDFITVQYESNENSNHQKVAFITNINNQIVREIEIPNQANWSTVIDVADLTAGLYALTLIDGTHKEVLKLIKN